MIDKPDNDLIKAFTGLEGGCVACGSTCGVLTGGALGFGMAYEADIDENGISAQKRILARVGKYIKWFEKTYGTARCRERTCSDFYTVWGQLKYFLTFYRLSGCFRHIHGAMRYLYLNQSEAPFKKTAAKNQETPLHCAQTVLQGIRKKIGSGNKRLEKLSFVFDGGVGLSGGLCGALAGAITGINLVLGISVRDNSYWQTIKGFGIGHVNLLIDRPFGTREPFAAGRRVVEKFKETAGALECKDVTGKIFNGWDDFQGYIRDADRCHELMGYTVEQAVHVIQQIDASGKP